MNQRIAPQSLMMLCDALIHANSRVRASTPGFLRYPLRF